MTVWRQKIAASCGLAVFIVGASGAGHGIVVTRHRSKVNQSCALPSRDYQHVNYKQGIVVPSQIAVPLVLTTPTNPNPTAARVNYFQLDTNSVVIDQCSISQFALVLRDDGVWSVSLRANQNPLPLPADPIPKAPLVAPDSPRAPSLKTTLHINRNQFVVRICGYAGYDQPSKDPKSASGHPMLFDLGPLDFWVQNGQPREDLNQGVINDGHFKDEFDLIDRVELDFTYQ